MVTLLDRDRGCPVFLEREIHVHNIDNKIRLHTDSHASPVVSFRVLVYNLF